jgi:hypothetical protein
MGNCNSEEELCIDYFASIGKIPLYTNPRYELATLDISNETIIINLDAFRIADKKYEVQLETIENDTYRARYRGIVRDLDVKLLCIRPSKKEIADGIICFIHLTLSYSGNTSIHNFVTKSTSTTFGSRYI